MILYKIISTHFQYHFIGLPVQTLLIPLFFLSHFPANGADIFLKVQPADIDGYFAIVSEYPLTYPLFYNRLKSSLVSSKLMSEDFLTRKALIFDVWP
jgi:hypothetical protein